MSKVLTIQDMSCYGQCSLTVALPILSAMGLETIVLPTAILSTHTSGFKNFTCLDLTDEMKKIIEHWENENICFDAVYTGYLGGIKQVELAKEYISTFKDKFILIDPAMADNGKLYPAFDNEYVEHMKEYCKLASLLCPNVTESFMLAGLERPEEINEEVIYNLLMTLRKLGYKQVLITGVKFNDTELSSCYLENDEMIILSDKKIPKSFHGTGDIYASVLFGSLVKESTLEEAIKKASTFTATAVKNTINDDDHWYGVHFEEELHNLK